MKFVGTVKFWNEDRGFGFLQREDLGPDTFVHARDLEFSNVGNVNTGDRLEYSIEPDRRTGKLKAVDIRRLAND